MRLMLGTVILLVSVCGMALAGPIPVVVPPGSSVVWLHWWPRGNAALAQPALPQSPMDGMPIFGEGANPDPACCRLGAAAVGPNLVWPLGPARSPLPRLILDRMRPAGYGLCPGGGPAKMERLRTRAISLGRCQP